LIYKKKVNIVITGADGFIASNLIKHLQHDEKYLIYKITKKTKKNFLKKYLLISDIIFHLAGENRPKKISLFNENNEKFTKKICDILIENNIKSKLIYISSSQVNLKNAYGISKANTEKIIKNFRNKNKIQVSIIRLPNVFGKWSKHNYNSFIATLCYKIPRKMNFVVNNRNLELVYIDDVINKLISFLYKQKINIYEKVNPVYRISVKKIVTLINKFNSKKHELFVDNLGNNFEKKLYSTYLSFLPKNRWFYKIKINKDNRGDFAEFIKTKNSGQVSIFSINPKKSRGGHFHHTKNEKFLIFNGKIKILFKNVLTNDRFSKIIEANNNKIFKSIPGWAHKIKNLTSNKIYGLVWANELLNVSKPDTIKIST
jgi:UDP-2-acetamido-2,6-beta-L-arabino-hexul-4-ose reductase